MVEDLKPGLKSRQMYLIIFLEWEEMVTNVEAIKIKAVHVGFGWGKLEWQNAGREEFCGFRAAMQKTPVSLQNAVCLFLMVWFIFWGLQYILKHFLLFLYVVSIRVAWEDPFVIRKWCVYSTQSQNHTVISKHSKDLFLSPCVCVCVCVPCMQVFAWLFLIFAGYVFWRWHLE